MTCTYGKRETACSHVQRPGAPLEIGEEKES